MIQAAEITRCSRRLLLIRQLIADRTDVELHLRRLCNVSANVSVLILVKKNVKHTTLFHHKCGSKYTYMFTYDN